MVNMTEEEWNRTIEPFGVKMVNGEVVEIEHEEPEEDGVIYVR
jgi:hypothetical protein